MDDQGQKFEKRTVGGVPRFDRARRAVLKRIRAIAALPVLFALCASGIVLLLPDRYEASVTIQINPRQKLPVSVASGMSAQEIERHTIEGEIETLRSGAVVDHVIAALGLNRDPEFAPGWPAALIDRVLSLGSVEPDGYAGGCLQQAHGLANSQYPAARHSFLIQRSGQGRTHR